MESLRIAQPSSAAGSGLEVGITARYGFMPDGGNNQIPFKLQSGCLNQTTLQMFADVNGKKVPIPLEGNRESLTVNGCLGWDFILDLDAVQAIIRAAELYDDLPLVAHLSDIRGEVLVRQPGIEDFYPAREGGPLNVGGEVLTGANSEVYLSISDGAVIRLGPNSIFGLEMGINAEEVVMPRFRLELGEMEVVSGSGGFLIYTPNEVLGAIGSAALVTVSPDGEASMDCISGDCFQYDGTEETEGVKDDLPDAVAAALDIVEDQLNDIGGSGNATDSDGDGVPNDLDVCPEKGDRGYGIDALGCPLFNYSTPFIDTDGDGYPDEVDLCPDVNAVTGTDLDGNLLIGDFGCPVGDDDFDGVIDSLEEDSDSDGDGDGMNDSQDLCPDLHGSKLFLGCPLGDFDHDGIPDSEEDSDYDGIPDSEDICPTASGRYFLTDMSYQITESGCPFGDNNFNGIIDVIELSSDLDSDGDGVVNSDDDCITQGFTGSGLGVDEHGCPDIDSDGDGVSDSNDSCHQIGDMGFGLDSTGCPNHPPDSDGDGVSDYHDRCMDESVPVSGVDSHGCPFDIPMAGSWDWDGDGYIDREDKCPLVYAPNDLSMGRLPSYGCPYGDDDFNGVPDGRECIPGEICNDSDGDGWLDDVDLCPGVYNDLQPGTKSSSNHGCPLGDYDHDGVPDNKECEGCIPPGSEEDPSACLDRDQDGVCVEDDLCPFVTGSLINKGCKEADSDGDGVRDGVDLCPGIVDPLRGVTPLGCPRVFTSRLDGRNTEDVTANTPITGDEITVLAPTFQLPRAIDKDSDGYADRVDQCPTQGDEGYGLDLNGCPLSPPAADADGDGFADDHDNCPNQGDQGYGLGRDGCPLPPPADSDGDGIIDAEDACPALGDQGAGLRDNGCPVSGKATADPDGDGIVGSLDKCPEQGGDVGLDGCPKKAGDSDGDGVADDRDSCPNQGSLGYGISRDGCPLKPPDSDGDGVADNQDKCPNKGDLGYGITADGCPAGAPDSDGDGVNDSVDKCPDKGDHGFGVDKSGCPLSNPNPPTAVPAKDSDGDGINDNLDKCPNEGDAGYGINARGCPNPPPEPTAAPPEPTAVPPEPTDAPPEPTADPT